MPVPTTYSANDDLVPIYVQDAAVLPDSIARLHEEAARQINDDLRARGWDDEDLAALTETALANLVKPACCYVMALLFEEKSNSERGTESLDKAKHWETKYKAALAAAVITTTLEQPDDPAPRAGGYVVLG